MAKEPADDLAVWLGGLKWVEGAWMQTTRLSDVVHAWFAALNDARSRAQLRRDQHRIPDDLREPRHHAVQPGDRTRMSDGITIKLIEIEIGDLIASGPAVDSPQMDQEIRPTRRLSRESCRG
jgi:hypothetical protein